MLDAFLKAFSSRVEGQVDLWISGQRVPVAFRRGARGATTVIFSFHGAVRRDIREIPAYVRFSSRFDPVAHQVSISDPSMLVPGDFGAAWYAGHDDFRTQQELPAALKAIAEALDARRVIFWGGSAGGFAAMYYAWHHPGSICLAVSPQTNLLTYNRSAVEAYTRRCWSRAERLEEVAGTVCLNLGPLYAKGFRHTLVLLLSAGDSGHLIRQVIPFFAATRPALTGDNLVFYCGFWGQDGHSGSVAESEYMAWLASAVASPGTAAGDLLHTHHAMTAKDTAPPSADAPAREPGHSASDLQRADLLRDMMLRS